MIKRTEKGFTLIEIMMVIAIIGILSSISIVSYGSIRTKARDKATFGQIQSVQPIAYRCMKSAVTNSSGNPTVYLIAPYATAIPGTSFCGYNNGTANVVVPGYPDWPTLSGVGGWAYSTTDDAFMWCPPTSTLTTRPALFNSSYIDESMGGSRANGTFCYIMKNGSKYIWCTQDGCAKEGF